jgi:phage shock protein A
VQGQLREIREAQERADTQWEQLENEIATLRGKLRELEAQPEQHEETGLT